MDTKTTNLYIVAHDGGCEGYSLPILAFTNKADAIAWKKVQTESYSITEVPIYPNFPLAEWFRLESVNETN